MLFRNIKSAYIRPRVLGFQITNAGTPSVSEGCKDDVSSVTDNGTGDSSLNFYEPFQRSCVAVTTPIGGTGAISTISTVSKTAARLLTCNAAGAAADMNFNSLIVGYDSAETMMARPLYHNVKAGRFRPVLIGGSFDSSGTLLSGKRHFTVSAASSTYTVTLRSPFATVPVVVATATGSTAKLCRVTSTAVNTFVIDTFDDAGGASTSGVNFFVLGWHSKEYARARRTELYSRQRGSRLIACEVTVTAGVPAVSINAQEASVSDDGTGLMTLTWTQAFKRAPEVVAVATGTDIATVVSSSTTACQIKTYTNAGVAGDTGKVYLVAMGYDVTEEY